MRCTDRDAWSYGYLRNWDSRALTSSARTEHTEISRRRFGLRIGGDTEPISRFFKLPQDGLSNTLRAGTDCARGAFTSPRPIHYKYARCITVREMARLHGFPDWFRLHSTKWHGARQVGNAVPPPLAMHVASAIIAAIGVKLARPQKRIVFRRSFAVRAWDERSGRIAWGARAYRPQRQKERCQEAKAMGNGGGSLAGSLIDGKRAGQISSHLG